MILSHVHILGEKGPKDICIEAEQIIDVADSRPLQDNPQQYAIQKFEVETIAFPGLINSHDHLDFNLFRQTGNRIYNNYSEWATDMQQHNKHEFDEVLKIPHALRVQWGLYKNLLNGFTTVVNHGGKLSVDDNIISVFQECHSLHSVLFEKNWKQQLNYPFAKKQPYVIHAGEGTDTASKKEIDKLLKWNLLKKELVAVHGVAMTQAQAKHFKALVWCPASNYFLLNATADIGQLKTKTDIVFGTDSTLSAGWNAWDHIRQARDTGMVTDQGLIDMLTIRPAAVWGLKGLGKIAQGMNADVVIAKRKIENDNTGSFFSLQPEDILLVLHNGKVRLFDENSGEKFNKKNFEKIRIGNSYKYVQPGINTLLEKIREYIQIDAPFMINTPAP